MNKTHGMTHTRFWKIFDGLKGRTKYPKNNRFHLYGGRGIECEWDSFESFKRDMYESYVNHVLIYGERNTQIDRIDSDGNYCKKNCRWATVSQQSRNRRYGRYTFNGETLSLIEWAEKVGINRGTLWSRIKRGMPPEKVFKNEYYGHR